MADDRKYVKLFCDMLQKGQRLKDAEFGRLIRAALLYTQTGEEMELTGNEVFLWDSLKMDIDRANEAYQKKVEANRENGQKGGRPAKPKETQDNPENPVGFSETQITQLAQDKRTKSKDKEKSKENTGDIPPIPPAQTFAYSVEFERFWAAYPRREGKGAAYKAFQRIAGVPLDVMLFAVEQQRRSRQWTENNGQYIPMPATWLNQRRWEDSPTTTAAHGGSFAEMEAFDDEPQDRAY